MTSVVGEETRGESGGLIDRVRDFWNRRPCNIRHSPKTVGTKEYFDEVEARKYFVEPHIPGFAQFERWRGKKVLEIGCGIGTDTINFARAGAEIAAVELSEASLDLCRQRFDVFGLHGKFYAGNAEHLSDFVPLETYDLIYSFGVIHHSPHPGLIIEQIRKYTGPETEIRVMLYSKWSWKVLWILLAYGHGAFWRMGELVARYSEAETGCPVTFVYSAKDVRQLFQGFKVLTVQKDHIFPYQIEKYINYDYRKVWYFRWMPPSLFHRFEKLFGWHTIVVVRATPR